MELKILNVRSFTSSVQHLSTDYEYGVNVNSVIITEIRDQSKDQKRADAS